MNFELAIRKHISKYLYCMYFIDNLEKEIKKRCELENRERVKADKYEGLEEAKRVASIKIYIVPTDRIGELVFRGIEIKQEKVQNEKKNILGVYIPDFTGWKSTNLRFLKGFSREFFVVDESSITEAKVIIKKYRKKIDVSEIYKWNETKDYVWNIKLNQSVIHMTEEEVEESKQMIFSQKIMNMSQPYICFAARDQAYLSNAEPNLDISYHTYRNSRLQDMKKGIEYCNEQKIQCILMGKKYEESNLLQGIEYIDYSRKYYNELLDWYFMSNCKFYFGDFGGIGQIPQMLGVPIAFTNMIPTPVNMTRFICKKEDLTIFKKLWSERKKRYLTLNEMWDLMDNKAAYYTEFYEKNGIKVISNTSDEIYELVKEMNERLDGTYSNKRRSDELRRKYLSLLKKWCMKKGYDYDNINKMRIGTDFLEKNEYLFEEEEEWFH